MVPVILFVVCILLVALVLGGAIFLQQAGIAWCEDSTMMKLVLGGFFAVYIVSALALKLALPPVGGDQVDMHAVTGVWGRQWEGLGVTFEFPEPFKRLLIRSEI